MLRLPCGPPCANRERLDGIDQLVHSIHRTVGPRQDSFGLGRPEAEFRDRCIPERIALDPSRDIYVSGTLDRHAGWREEPGSPEAAGCPRPDECAVLRILFDLIPAIVRQVNVVLSVDRDPERIGVIAGALADRAPAPQEDSRRVELLDPADLIVGHIDVTRTVHGDAYGFEELSGA